jgi:ribosomal protein S18 acetylase RimI-like enzyme
MNSASRHPRLVLRRFEEADEEALISWFATRDELRLFAGDSLRWPLDRRQLALIRSDPGVTAWTAVAGAGVATSAAGVAAPAEPEVIVGHVELTRLPDRGWCRLARVAIAPQHRGHGFGFALVSAALEQARSAGAFGVDLRVFESNSIARATYRAAGFSDIGRDRAQPDLRWMIKELERR